MLDIATSVVSNGQIRTYANQGKPLPEGWVISREGRTPITDGKKLDEGMFVPMSTYKGSGLAIVLGLLGGPLNRAAFGRDVKDVNSPAERESNTGHFIVALDRRKVSSARHLQVRDGPSHPRSCIVEEASRRR